MRSILRSGLTATARRLNALSPELATQFLDVTFPEANFADRFLLSAWGTLSARLRPLLTETVIRSVAGADFTPWELRRSNTPVTVYLRWPERDLLALSPLVRLLWGSFIDELITTYNASQGTDCRPVLLLIDEAGRTAIPSLADTATTVVGRGISLWIAIQSLSQLDAVYGRPHAHTLRDNMETQIYYRPANQETAEYLERFSDWGWRVKLLLVPLTVPVGHALLFAVGAVTAASWGQESEASQSVTRPAGWWPGGSGLSTRSPHPSSPRERSGLALSAKAAWVLPA